MIEINTLNKISNMSSSIYQEIKENRTYLMGISMIFVLFYHAFCWIYNPIGAFNIGYCGVDLFLFLSGFGLCVSYEKNTLIQFYKHRLVRIFPLYALSVCIAFLICHKQWNFIIFLENLTTLGFYINGGINRFDWYINALITLYVLFPVFYLLSRLKYISLILTTLVVAGLLWYFDDKIEWWYDCFISRLPIFLYGIMFQKCQKSVHFVSAMGCVLFIPCYLFVSKFLATALIAVPIIMLSLFILPKCHEKIKQILKFCGQYSLEIYLANVIVLYVSYTSYTIVKILLYILIQFVLTALFITFTKTLKHYATKSTH